MLSWLSIQGLALVESVELAFDPGLNVLTGETGAGKSLILGSIGLLLGERADAAWLRSGEERGSVDGTFELKDRPDLVESLLPLAREALDAFQYPLLRQMGLVQHLVDGAAGAPAIVPVGRHRVLIRDPVPDPISHRAPRDVRLLISDQVRSR